ncbi:hypothetical protein ZEAMMB73_Zm00001d001834 [Zea mays]|uniref:Uncharacterized protein n=1 Tax=Zea mays TaxID=4577 RepID=A0A1D6DTF7_MAIZE|nr:hypothetical protein ZEAMMB73_Zm00001d001834 [Zea mays]
MVLLNGGSINSFPLSKGPNAIVEWK